MTAIERFIASGELLSARDTVRLVGQPHPLRSLSIDRAMPAGLSIAEMLDAVRADTAVPHTLWVWIGPDRVPPELWPRLRPKPGAVVTFKAALHGDNPLRTVLALAIAVAAAVVAGPIAGALGFTAGTIGFSLATAAIGSGILVGGTLALNALIPARPPQLAATSNGGAFTDLASIQGARNEARPYEAVPVVLGRHRVSPTFAAKPYTELIGDDQYLRLLFCWGYGPVEIDTEQLKIGETPLAQFTDIEIEHRTGLPSDIPVTLYPSQVDEQQLAIELTAPDSDAVLPVVIEDADVTWQVRVTAPDCDFISVDITFPEGVSHVDDDGNIGVWYSGVTVQYRTAGSADAWSDLARGIGGAMRALQTVRRGAGSAVARGQYEVRAGKIAKSATDQARYKDKAVWTALRSFTNAPPLAFDQPLALTAIRIRATDQLSGIIDTFNGVVSSKVTAYDGAAWHAETVSRNPADLFRWMLQGPFNARAVGDDAIDLDNLAEFWTYCDDEGFTFDQVRGRSSVYAALADIAAAGRAAPTFIDGKWGVVWDRPDDPIVQHFTPRNSWGLSGQRAYPRLPHGWRVRFINAANGYTDDERIVYDDGYSAANAALFEAIEFPGVTDPDLIWRHGRYRIADARLRPERITINVAWEHLVCTRASRVELAHDVLLIGIKSARVKAVAGQLVTLDERVLLEADKTYSVEFRHPDEAIGIFRRAVEDGFVAGETTALTLVGDLSDVESGLLCSFGETERESAIYRVAAIEHAGDLVARLTLVDDAPDIASADTGAIPAYTPNITIPADPYTLPPQDLQYQEVIDGVGAATRALVRLSWQMPRLGRVQAFEAQLRDDDGALPWTAFAMVAPPNRSVDVPIVNAGVWSFRVRCVFTDGTVSAWVSLVQLNLLALSFAPGDVTNLHQTAVDGQTVLDWDPVVDQRPLHYEIRKGTSWDAGLLVGDEVERSPWKTTGDGTYHIRAYVLSPFATRIYSAATASIEIEGSIISRNIIVSRDELDAGWTGGLDGGVTSGSFIRTDAGLAIAAGWAQEVVDLLALEGLHIAVYVSPTVVDIGRPAECRFWSEFDAAGVLQGEDFLAGGDVLAEPDILGAASARFIRAFPIWRFAVDGAIDVFAPVDVFAPADVFSADVTWKDWVAVASGTRVERFFLAGFVLISDKEDIDATGIKFRWFVDVPDRTDDYTNLAVPDTGLALTFYPGGYNGTPTPGVDAVPFNGGRNGADAPHVQRAIVDPTSGDSVEISDLTLAGCTVKVRNGGGYVARDKVALLVRGY